MCSLILKVASISISCIAPVRGDQCGGVQKHSWQQSFGDIKEMQSANSERPGSGSGDPVRL